MSKFDIRDRIAQRIPQFQNKQSLIVYYMNFEFPEKQVNLIQWWEKVLHEYFLISKKLTLTLSEAQQLFAFHGLKPLPLKNLLQFYVDKGTFDYQTKKLEPVNQNWFSKMTGILWKQERKDRVQDNPNAKLFMPELLNEKFEKLKNKLPQIFNKDTALNNDYFMRVASETLNLSEDLGMIIFKLQREKYIKTDNIDGDHAVVLYHKEKKNVSSEKWCSIEKAKYLLNSRIQYFEGKVEQKCQKMDDMVKKAKDYLENGDRQSAKIVLQGRKPYQQGLKSLTLRRETLINTLHQIQFNQMNNESIDVLKLGQNVIKDTMADMSDIDSVIENDREIRAQQNMINDGFKDIVDQSLDQEVDEMMNQIQQEVSKSRLSRDKQSRVRPEFPEDSNKMDIEGEVNTREFFCRKNEKQEVMLN